jgi:outer membrane protein OmpA-like peptidoglycan-associated protein
MRISEKERHTRARSTAALATVLALTAFVGGGAAWTARSMERDLGRRAALALAAARVPVTAEVRGRDVVLSGQVADPQQATAALVTVGDLAGIRTVRSLMTITEAHPGANRAPSGSASSGRTAHTPTTDPHNARNPHGNVLFPSASTRISTEAEHFLDGVAAYLKNHPRAVATIAEHSDSQGAADVNAALATSRADTVARYLVTRGAAPRQVRVTPYGSARPAASNRTDAGRAANRRVEVSCSEGS